MNGLEYIFHPDNSIIEKIFFEYKILIKKHIDSMIIIINDFENNFTLNFFKKIIFFESDETIDHKGKKFCDSNTKLNDTKDWARITLSLNKTLSKNEKK